MHENLLIYIGEISFSLFSFGRGGGLKISDKYSARDEKLAVISKPLSNSTSIIKDPYEDENYAQIKETHKDLIEFIKDDKISTNEGKWFVKTENMISDIVNYLNSIISGAPEVFIIDPYADDEMIQLVIRLNSNKITVISSSKVLPKHTIENTKNKILDYKKKIKELQSGIDRSKFFFIPKEFHDRFIMIKQQDANLIYCLPNSINAMLKNDDFLILKLNGKVKQQAQEHIEFLITECTDDCLLKAEK